MELVQVKKYNSKERIVVTCETIEEIVEELTHDKCYHFQLQHDTVYTLMFDLDDKQSEFFKIEDFIEFLSTGFKISEDDIFYTRNYSKEHLYHVSVPSISGTIKQQLQLVKEINSNGIFKIDETIYKKGLWRAPNQSKEKDTKTIHHIRKGCLNDFIVYDLSRVKFPLSTSEEKYQKQSQINNSTKIRITVEQAYELINLIDRKMADSYNDWITILFCLKCENNDDFFQVFDHFSKFSEKYNYNACLKKWNSYIPKDNRIYTYNTLFKLARSNNIDGYKLFIEKNGIFGERCTKIDTLEIDQEYLLADRKLSNCEVSKMVKTFINTELRGLIVKSAYDTGKTTLLKQISNYTRILFISYRITLTENLMGGFKELGFKTYTEEIDADKLICQLDSIEKIPDKEFDLIIMDESESLLNHLSSSTIKNSYQLWGMLQYMTKSCKKIIALDGDVNERTKIFMNEMTNNNVKMINNKNIKNTKHFIFHRDEEKFNKLVEDDLKNSKNICIVSMSESIAKRFYEDNKDQYRSILYTATTSDKQKQMLCDVTTIWSNHQLVVYSPSIESGVDYNVEHFDKVYIIMASGSTSQRGLFQMMNRIRKLRSNETNVYLNNIPANDTSVNRHYIIDEIEKFYENDEKVDNVYESIMFYNKLEELNKNATCFLPLFIKMLEAKGHTYCFAEEQIKRFKTTNPNIEQIIQIGSIAKEDAVKLMENQKKRNLEEQEKYQLLRWLYENTFKVAFDNEETVNKFYKRLDMVKNHRRLMSGNGKSYDKIVNQLKNCIFGDSQTTNTDTLKQKVELFNQIIQCNKIELGLAKTTKVESTNKLLAILKPLLSLYGFEITSKTSHGKSIYTIQIIAEVSDVINRKVDTTVIDEFIEENIKVIDGK